MNQLLKIINKKMKIIFFMIKKYDFNSCLQSFSFLLKINKTIIKIIDEIILK